ncbi:nucleotidyltransferase family protein [Brevundimonas sp.]|jgi:predicted nucleotidyltransferase|uniref:nucleotidyltransferase family protein n=1 Tax=Brevundimonas sp. TaxID=1871086 RepID=UPI0037833C5E
MTRDELLTRLRELKPWLEEQGIVNVRLFGSYARDEAGPDSDVDLLVDLSRPIGWHFFSVKKEVASRLGHKVDMCPDDGLNNPHIRRTAMRDAIAI